jgi:hypothetical protein
MRREWGRGSLKMRMHAREERDRDMVTYHLEEMVGALIVS